MNRAIIKALFFLLILLILDGCSYRIKGIGGRHLSSQVIDTVPFYPQENDNYCGPVALSIVSKYWGYDIDPDKIIDEVYRSEISGTSIDDMRAWAQKKGLNSILYHSSPKELAEYIEAGIPLITIVDVNPYFYVPHLLIHKNIWGHAFVVFGFDDVTKTIITHSHNEPNKKIPYDTFFDSWRETNWTALVLWPNYESNKRKK